MATEPSNGGSNQFSEYERLAAEYKACELSCQAGLDRLRAAERELRASHPEADRHADLGASAEIEKALRQIADRNNSANAEAVGTLSTRERNVFELIGQGLPTGAIAKCLGIAISTAETYRERLKDKLKLESGLELTRFAILWFASQDKARTRADVLDD